MIDKDIRDIMNTNKLFPRAEPVELDEYEVYLTNVTMMLITADIKTGMLYSDRLTPSQIESRISIASKILYQVKYRDNEEFG